MQKAGVALNQNINGKEFVTSMELEEFFAVEANKGFCHTIITDMYCRDRFTKDELENMTEQLADYNKAVPITEKFSKTFISAHNQGCEDWPLEYDDIHFIKTDFEWAPELQAKPGQREKIDYQEIFEHGKCVNIAKANNIAKIFSAIEHIETLLADCPVLKRVLIASTYYNTDEPDEPTINYHSAVCLSKEELAEKLQEAVVMNKKLSDRVDYLEKKCEVQDEIIVGLKTGKFKFSEPSPPEYKEE